MGDARYERAYYYCLHCEHGHMPTDEEFGLESKSRPGAREVIALVGATAAFAEGANIELHCLTGLTLSASSVQRVTEAVGDEGAARVAAVKPWVRMSRGSGRAMRRASRPRMWAST